MEIIVEGKAKEFFIPNQVIISFEFISKNKNYEDTLNNGLKMIEEFINKVILKNGFTKEDLKTSSFTIKEEKKYNESTHAYEFYKYSYNQNASLKFDYDNERLSNIINDISKLNYPPIYQIDFGIKNKEECHKKLLTKAYNDALEQAQIIATAANKELIKCIKVDFKPFTQDYISQVNLDIEPLALTKNNTSQVIFNAFTPEDILITETLYCIWIAE